MFGLAITVVLLILTVVIFRKSKFKKLLKIPGPLLPKGMKGDLPDLMKNPRFFSQHMTSTYGNIYRFVLFCIKQCLINKIITELV